MFLLFSHCRSGFLDWTGYLSEQQGGCLGVRAVSSKFKVMNLHARCNEGVRSYCK